MYVCVCVCVKSKRAQYKSTISAGPTVAQVPPRLQPHKVWTLSPNIGSLVPQRRMVNCRRASETVSYCRSMLTGCCSEGLRQQHVSFATQDSWEETKALIAGSDSCLSADTRHNSLQGSHCGSHWRRIAANGQATKGWARG